MMDRTEWVTIQQRLTVGQSISVETDSPLYRGPYSSEILAVSDEGIRIAMPLEAGRLVIIPVGTALTVSLAHGGVVVATRVVDRRGGRDRYLELAVSLQEETPPPEAEHPSAAPVLSVTSGKGGVGKSTIVVNLAIALEQYGKRVCIVDADLGTANVDVLLNLTPPYNLGDVVNGKKHMIEVLIQGPKGVLILPGGSGLRHLTRLRDDEFVELLVQFQSLEEYADIIIIDTGSGISSGVTHFVAASTASVLVTTPDPHAKTDAYALLKILAEQDERVPMHLVVNRVHDATEGEIAAQRMVYAAQRFLQYEVSPIGYIREDSMVARSVRQQVDLVSQYPRSRAALDLQVVTENVARIFGHEVEPPGGRRGAADFLRRMRSLLPARGKGEAFRA